MQGQDGLLQLRDDGPSCRKVGVDAKKDRERRAGPEKKSRLVSIGVSGASKAISEREWKEKNTYQLVSTKRGMGGNGSPAFRRKKDGEMQWKKK